MGSFDSPPDLVEYIRRLESRVSALERSPIKVAAGTPTDAVADGHLRGDSSANRLWLRVGGTWRYTTLT